MGCPEENVNIGNHSTLQSQGKVIVIIMIIQQSVVTTTLTSREALRFPKVLLVIHTCTGSYSMMTWLLLVVISAGNSRIVCSLPQRSTALILLQRRGKVQVSSEG